MREFAYVRALVLSCFRDSCFMRCLPALPLLMALVSHVQAGENLSAVTPADLVRLLGSDSFREREAAYGELLRRGASAIDALRTGMAGKDAEIRRRSLVLLARLEDAAIQAEIIKPRPVRLRFGNVPLRSAISEIEELTGLPILAPTALSEVPRLRRVTLDIGDAPFWQAWERFCQDAGVHEPTTTWEPPGPLALVRLHDGKARRAPCFSPPLRVRALSWVKDPLTRRDDDPDQAMLEIRAEPHLDLVGIDAVRITRVTMAEGKAISFATPIAQTVPQGPALLVDGSGRATQGRAAWLVPVSLPELKMEPREIAGVIDARFLVRHPVVSIPAPAQASGKTLSGLRGMTLTIEQADTEDGVTTLTVQLDRLDALLATGPGEHEQRIRPGVVATRDPLAVLLEGLTLRDAKGRPLPREDFQRLGGGKSVRCRLSYVGGPDVQLVLMAPLLVGVEVTFAV